MEKVDERVETLKKLFRGRTDVHGLIVNDSPVCAREPITDTLLLQHLQGKKRIGVYPIIPPDTVHCACVDFDFKPPAEEDREKIEKAIAALIDHGFYPYLERSRSKGYHVWIFFDDGIKAGTVRTILQGILKEVGVDDVEIFPKQDAVTSNNGVGNFVFLPEFGKSVKEQRTVFVNGSYEPYADQWEVLRKVHFTKTENILQLSKQYPEKLPEPRMMPTQGENNSLGPLDIERYLNHYDLKYKTKQETGRTFYLLERCLFADEHTTKDNPGDSSIIQGADGKLGYQCFHNHCAFKTWADARKAISGDDSLAQFCEGYVAPPQKKERGSLLLESAIFDADHFITIPIPSKRKILNPWLSEQSINLIAGWRGTGKTWFGMSAFDAITRGEPFGPWTTETPVPSLYLDGEMAGYDDQERVKQLNLSSSQSRKAPLYIYSDAYANSLGIPRANLLSQKWRESFKAYLTDKQIKLVAIDNISSLAAGIDENSKFEWDPINQWLLSLRFIGITTVLFHHTSKEGNQRGTSAREDNLDCSIMLQRPHDYMAEQGAKFVVKFKKARVRMSELSLMGDVEFTLTEIDGRLQWTWGGVKRKNQLEILRMLDEGVAQSDIAQTLGVSKGFVSQVKTVAIKKGHLTKTGKLTPEGFALVSSGEKDEEIY